MKKILVPVMMVFMLLVLVPARAQNVETKPKVKTIVVYEEKLNVLVARKYKESEVTYDKVGNILETISYKDGKMTEHFKYQYDANNNKIKEEEYDAAGKLIESSEYKIENGLRVEKVVYDENHKIKEKKTYVYTLY
ncbi:MAG: hypothetical protein U0X39_02275 [Bacteroidales bacterium]